MQRVNRYISHLINLLIILFVRPEKFTESQQKKLDLLNQKKMSLAKDIYDYNKKYEHICFTCKDVCCAAKGEGDRHEPVDFLLDQKIRSEKKVLFEKNAAWYEIKIKRTHRINAEKASPCPYLDTSKGCMLEKPDRPILCPQWFCAEFYKVWTIRELLQVFKFINEATSIRLSVLWIAVSSFFKRNMSEK